MDGVPATVNVATTGVHVVNVWMREDGFVFDKLLLTTNSSVVPSGSGPLESPRKAAPAGEEADVAGASGDASSAACGESGIELLLLLALSRRRR